MIQEISDREGEVIKNSLNNYMLIAARDYELLTFTSATVFTEKLKNMGGPILSSIFIVTSKDHGKLYWDSEKFEDIMAFIDKKFKDTEYLDSVMNRIIILTDYLNDFTDRCGTKEFLINNKHEFLENYKEFMFYNIFYQFQTEYLVDTEEKIKFKDLVFKYHEMTPIKVDKMFKKLDIGKFCIQELEESLNSENPLETSIKKYRNIFYYDNSLFEVPESDAREFENEINKKARLRNESVNKDAKELRGVGASQGQYKGRAKVITNLNELHGIEKGVVLVTTSTRPNFNKEIKEAGAIISENGGALCHAAVVSREYNIPCVVAVPGVTSIIKDGDIVELDGKLGEIKIFPN
ncbi:MAG: PEP-utilizing enzyme [Patescibacteria group bacterium]|nr:PEP-utilizing enzyme [Patescibacteria group bacterium]